MFKVVSLRFLMLPNYGRIGIRLYRRYSSMIFKTLELYKAYFIKFHRISEQQNQGERDSQCGGEKIVFHPGYALAHPSNIAKAELCELGQELLSPAMHFSALAPIIYWELKNGSMVSVLPRMKNSPNPII